MDDQSTRLTGIIPCNGKHFTFFADGHQFTIMDHELALHKTEIIDSSGNFIFGKTYDEHDIAIYTGEARIYFRGCHRINTSAYFLSTGNMAGTDLSYFEGIEFFGGTLNNLLGSHLSENVEYINEKDFIVKQGNNELHYSFNTEEGVISVHIGSHSTMQHGISGFCFQNTGVFLRLQFSKPEQLDKAFKHYWKIKELVSFMTYRNNVSFDEVYLLHDNNEYSIPARSAQLFMKDDTISTKKDLFHNICFEDLEENVANLLQILYSSKDKKPSYSFGFLPASDRDVSRVTNEKIKAICTGLECELNFIKGLIPLEEQHLQDLICQVKRVVEDHQKSDERLSDKTYSLIRSSINHWTLSASDRCCHLFHRYKEEMGILMNRFSITIQDEDIQKVIKYRNDITHGSYRIMDMSIAEPACLMPGLVYFCLLSRIGLDKQTIQRLCRDRKILS